LLTTKSFATFGDFCHNLSTFELSIIIKKKTLEIA